MDSRSRWILGSTFWHLLWTISITDKSNIKGIATRSIIIIITGSYEYEIVLYEYDAQVQYLSVLRSGPRVVHE